MALRARLLAYVALVGVVGPLESATRAANAADLTVSDVERVISQGVAEAEAIGLPVAIVVVDHEGNVLGAFRMAGVCPDTAPCAGPVLEAGGRDGQGLEGFLVQPLAATSELGMVLAPATGLSGAVLAAISKAGTAAFFSTRGNAFSTRSAAFIIQENFPPGVTDAPSGPLFGVQFSQLLCSDINPKLPLGLSGDPGGLPLYRGRRALGGVGVESGRTYGADRDPMDDDVTPEERIAVAATRGFETPAEIRGDRIYVGGLRLPFRNIERVPRRSLTAFADLQGVTEAPPRDPPPSGIRPATLGGVRGGVLVDAASERFSYIDSVDPPVDAGGLTALNVRRILGRSARQADITRAGIRRPIGDRARVNIAVVDLGGRVLGFFRTEDAPIFGIDVSVQKARSAAFFSSADAGERLVAEGEARVGGILEKDNLGGFVRAAAADGVRLDGRIALSDRAIGFLSRPFFPDGIHSTAHGPFSRPIQEFSIFNNGIQIELALEVLMEILKLGTNPVDGCTGVPGLQNGSQIFPGSVPLYRGRRLVGAVGVSGDGVDQDDIVAAAGSRGFEAPDDLRADRVIVRRVRLPYVKFPRRPTIR